MVGAGRAGRRHGPCLELDSTSGRLQVMTTRRIPECGHPERVHQAKGMCAQCYLKQYDANRERKKNPSEYAANYQKPPHKPVRMANCHPDRPNHAKGFCTRCYMRQRTNSVKATCHPERPHVARGLCTTCLSKERYDMDPETAQRQSRESQARIRQRNRDELLAAYGGKCACEKCPETNPTFLTLEHVNRDGKQHRKAVGSHTYADLRRRGYPQEGYTLLCWNCNAGSRFTGVCPHMQ